MENAAKALQIAGSVLFAMIVLGFIVLFYDNLSKVQQEREKAIEIQQGTDFNKIYESYNKETLLGSQIISLANKVIDNNKKYTNSNNDLDKYTPIEMIIRIKRTVPNKYFKDSSKGGILEPVEYKINISTTVFMKKYEDVMQEIAELSNKTLELEYKEKSSGNVIKRSFTYQQIDIMSEKLRNEFIDLYKSSDTETSLYKDIIRSGDGNYSEYEKFKSLIDDQEALSRQEFIRTTDFVYDLNNGRIKKIQFKEKT